MVEHGAFAVEMPRHYHVERGLLHSCPPSFQQPLKVPELCFRVVLYTSWQIVCLKGKRYSEDSGLAAEHLNMRNIGCLTWLHAWTRVADRIDGTRDPR